MGARDATDKVEVEEGGGGMGEEEAGEEEEEEEWVEERKLESRVPVGRGWEEEEAPPLEFESWEEAFPVWEVVRGSAEAGEVEVAERSASVGGVWLCSGRVEGEVEVAVGWWFASWVMSASMEEDS